MFEIKYYKDYGHNYMILEKRDIGERENYQMKMLTSNKIDGILKCSIRDINGAVYFYYDITSKVSLENLFKHKPLSYEQVRELFMQLDIIYRNLGRFFMDEKGLIMRPDCIYYDLSDKKYFGLYYPDRESGIENPHEELMDFLLGHIDTENQKLVDNMYQIYEMSESQSFMLKDAMQIFEEPEEDILDVHNIIEESVPIENAENNTASNSEYEMQDNYTSAFINDESYSKDKHIAAKQKSNGKNYGIFAFISIIGIVAAGYIFFNYKLTQQEFMMIICCLILMGLCFIFSIVQLALSGKKEREQEQEDRELQYDIEDEFRDERTVSLQGVLDKSINKKTEDVHRETEQNYGETIFIDTRRQSMEYKLYALDKKNKKHIELTQFPYTIGKMAGCVDCVLMDDSISRIHARIERQDEKILLTDMNSTNGTFKNGLRMEPSETVELEPGDEIRFGKLNYCYR